MKENETNTRTKSTNSHFDVFVKEHVPGMNTFGVLGDILIRKGSGSICEREVDDEYLWQKSCTSSNGKN